MKRADLQAAELPVLLIPCDAIDVPADRLRSFKEEQALAIGAAIFADAQYDPITVAQLPGSDRFTLVDGLHRLRGCQSQNITLIEARIGSADKGLRRRQEIMSAWARATHDAFDKAAQIAAMAALCQEANDKEDEDDADPCSTMLQALRWDEATAEMLGIHRTSVFRGLRLHKTFSPAQVQMLRDKKLADDAKPLAQLAALPPEDFERAMLAIESGEAESIAAALLLFTPEKAPAWEKSTAKLMKQVADWPSMYRKRLIDELLTRYDRHGNDKSAKDAAG